MHVVNNHRAARRYLIFASILIMVHGLIEITAIVSLFVPLSFHFVFEELNQAWQATVVVGIVSGVLRICAVFGILRNRLWGWVLGLVMCVITFSMLTLYLPAGAADSILAGGALILLLIGKLGSTPIFEAGENQPAE
jgi:hypothetical protein